MAFLNDYKERLNINDELEYFWNSEKSNYDKKFLDLVEKIHIEVFEDDDFYYIDGEEEQKMNRYFVMSTSMKKDSLGMWKYYSKNSSYNGYCMGLFIPALVDEWIDRDTGVAVEIGLVIYNHSDKQEKIREMVEELYQVWCTYSHSKELDDKIKQEYKSWISYASLFFKKECFASEEEMRFVAIAPTDNLKNLYYEEISGNKVKMYDFRNVNGVITPYLKMPLFGYNIENSYITNYIGVGPCLDFIQKRAGIKQFISSLDYQMDDLKIVESDIPLRY